MPAIASRNYARFTRYMSYDAPVYCKRGSPNTERRDRPSSPSSSHHHPAVGVKWTSRHTSRCEEKKDLKPFAQVLCYQIAQDRNRTCTPLLALGPQPEFEPLDLCRCHAGIAWICPHYRGFYRFVRPKQMALTLDLNGQSCPYFIPISECGIHPSSTVIVLYSIDFHSVLNDGKILLANLSTGRLTEKISGTMGSFLVTKIVNAAFRRANLPEAQRRRWHVIDSDNHGGRCTWRGSLLPDESSSGISAPITRRMGGRSKSDGWNCI